MTVEEAKWTLLYNRPERPRSEQHRRLQCAVDIAVEVLDKVVEDEKRGISDKQANT